MSKVVYVLCEKVDLGVEPLVAYQDKDSADAACLFQTKMEHERVMKSLITSCAYTAERAEEFVKSTRPFEVCTIQLLD